MDCHAVGAAGAVAQLCSTDSILDPHQGLSIWNAGGHRMRGVALRPGETQYEYCSATGTLGSRCARVVSHRVADCLSGEQRYGATTAYSGRSISNNLGRCRLRGGPYGCRTDCGTVSHAALVGLSVADVAACDGHCNRRSAADLRDSGDRQSDDDYNSRGQF